MLKKTLFAGMANLAASAMAWNNLPDVSNREFWDKQKDNPAYICIAEKAEEKRKEPIVDPTPLYEEFFRTGNRSNYEGKMFKLVDCNALILDCCITRNPESLAALEKRLEVIMDMKSWVYPAHDVEMRNHTGKDVTIDLVSARMAENFSVMLSLLRPMLDKKLADRMEKELFRRIIDPVDAIIDGKREVFPWMKKDNNWISVCNAGIIGTALRLDMPDARRNRIIDYLIKLNGNYIGGMGDEGYCSEGVAYWNYGFGHYMKMAMLLKQFDGRDILHKFPGMVLMAQYPERCSFAADFYPPYSDAPIEVKDDLFMLELRDILLNRRKGFSGKTPFYPLFNYIDYCTLYFSMYTGEPVIDRSKIGRELTTVFKKAGVYVARGGEKCAISASFKGGSNHEMHNHNDVGSYIVALDKVPVVIDPGAEKYTRRTFSMQRYESNLINSYGHSVPKIDGQLQASPFERMDTDAVLLEDKVSETVVSAAFDILPAYKHIAGVDKLHRKFEFDRSGNGRFTVTDTAEFSKKLSFENAVITFGDVKELGGNRYLITEKGKQLLLSVDSSAAYEFKVVDINEDTHHKRIPHRLTFAVKDKVENIKMVFTFTMYNNK